MPQGVGNMVGTCYVRKPVRDAMEAPLVYVHAVVLADGARACPYHLVGPLPRLGTYDRTARSWNPRRLRAAAGLQHPESSAVGQDPRGSNRVPNGLFDLRCKLSKRPFG